MHMHYLQKVTARQLVEWRKQFFELEFVAEYDKHMALPQLFANIVTE